MLKTDIPIRTTGDTWDRLEAEMGAGVGARCSIGLLALSTDRIGERDTRAFLEGFDGVELFATRVPMSAVATPQSLAAMESHLEAAAGLLVPGSRLDVVGFSCTSGTAAIGAARVAEAIRRARPGVAVTTPVEAGAEGLRQLGCRRISLLAPYRPATADLVSGYFEENGFAIDRKATFDLDGDPDMNRVTPEALIAAVPQANTTALQVMLLQADYSRGEAHIVKWLDEPSDRTALDDAAKKFPVLVVKGGEVVKDTRG